MFSYILACAITFVRFLFHGAGTGFLSIASFLEHYLNQLAFKIDVKSQIRQRALLQDLNAAPVAPTVVYEYRPEAETKPEDLN